MSSMTKGEMVTIDWKGQFWRLACCGDCMTPVDKASEKEKESVEKEEDLRNEWIQEDIRDEGRKPDLEEIEEDESIL
jgi:hypothetical protein